MSSSVQHQKQHEAEEEKEIRKKMGMRSFTLAVLLLSLYLGTLLSCSAREGRLFLPNDNDSKSILSGTDAVLPYMVNNSLPGYSGRLKQLPSRETPAELFVPGKSGVLRMHLAINESHHSFDTVHLGRDPVTVNLWTAIRDTRVQIHNTSRTAQATNRIADLIIYLDFTEPVQNTSAELLGALKPSNGILNIIHRKSHGNRRFGFKLANVTSVIIITIVLDTRHIISRDGHTVVQPGPVTFLFDSIRPKVKLSTMTSSKTRDRDVTVLIETTKPVFSFTSQALALEGGEIKRLVELSKSTYVLHLLVDVERVLKVSVIENKTEDIAGNLNLPSNVISVQHYIIPSISIAFYSFTTASFLATSFAAGVLSLSSATLAASGALSLGTMRSIVSDPSRNLLGMAGHLQVFALSEWLAVGLPIEYHETTRGLQWLIPHVALPWERKQTRDNPLFQHKLTSLKFVSRRTQIGTTSINCNKHTYPCKDISTLEDRLYRRNRVLSLQEDAQELPGFDEVGTDNQVVISSKLIKLKGRKLGAIASVYGLPLTPNEYQLFFEAHNSQLPMAANFPGLSTYTGWHDFKMNLFWLGSVGGALIFLHLCILSFLKWRTGTSLRSALLVPRFELFLLIFALPGTCQALAFIIRGGTTGGIIVGVILLAIPAAFLLSVMLFLFFALFVGKLVQYHEFRWVPDHASWLKRFVVAIVGANSVGTWTCKERLSAAFLPRFGLLFEDRKGPPKLVILNGSDHKSVPRWIYSSSNGIGRMRAVNSDDESEDAVVSRTENVIGVLRAGYVVVDLARRVALGLAFGAYPRIDRSWSQVSFVFGFTCMQFLYLVIFRPYIRRGVQIVETLCLLCEAALFALGVFLLAGDHAADNLLPVGIAMLALLLVTLVVQLVNEWYALMNQLLRLSASAEPSLKLGLKMFIRGLALPLIPQERWPTFFSTQPKTGLVTVVQQSPDERVEKRLGSVVESEVERASTPDVAIPAYGPGSPCFIDPRTAPALAQGESSTFGEISAELVTQSQGQGPQAWNQWDAPRAVEGKRAKGTKADVRSTELKALRELAKASFPKGRKDDKMPAEEEISSRASPSSLLVEQQTPSRRGREGVPYAIHSFSEDSSSENELEIELQQRQIPGTRSSSSLEKGTSRSARKEIPSSAGGSSKM